MSLSEKYVDRKNFPYRGGRKPNNGTIDDPLTEKQELFVAEYLVDLNGTQAAIRAGYKADNAGVTASEILKRPNVRAEIRKQYAAIYSSLGAKAQRVLAELCRIGFSDVRELFDEDGNLLNIKELPDSIAASVSSVEITRKPGRPRLDAAGNRIDDTEEFVSKVRLWDKTKALSMLGKHFGILKDVIEHTGPGGGPIQVESNSLQVESLPLAVKQLLVVVGSGKGISKELEAAILNEVESKYLEVEYEVLGRNGRGENNEPKQIGQGQGIEIDDSIDEGEELISTAPSVQFVKGSAHEFKVGGRGIGGSSRSKNIISKNRASQSSRAELNEMNYLDDL